LLIVRVFLRYNQDLEAEVESSRKKLSDQSKEFKVKVGNITTQLRQSEHRVKQKEAQIEQMLSKFDNLVRGERWASILIMTMLALMPGLACPVHILIV